MHPVVPVCAFILTFLMMDAIPPESSLPQQGSLPTESSLPKSGSVSNRVEPKNQLKSVDRGSPLPSESALPMQLNSPVHGAATTQTAEPKTVVVEQSNLPTESDIPQGYLAVQSTVDPQTKSNQEPKVESDLSNDELSKMLLTDEGETTPWLRLLHDGPTATIKSLRFSPDGLSLYAVGRDKVVHHWKREAANARNWQYQDPIRWQVGRGPRGYLMSIAPHARWLAFSGYGHKAYREIMILDANHRRLPALLDSKDLDSFAMVALEWMGDNEDADLLAADSTGGLVRWSRDRDQATWNPTRIRASVQLASDQRPLIRISDRLVATTEIGQRGENWDAVMIDTQSGRTQQTLNKNFPEDRSQLVLAEMLRKLTGLNADENAKAKAIQILRDASWGQESVAMSISPDKTKFAVADSGGWLTILDRTAGCQMKYFSVSKEGLNVKWDGSEYVGLAWSGDGKKLFALLPKALQEWSQQANGAWQITTTVSLPRTARCCTLFENVLAHSDGTQVSLRFLERLQDEPLRLGAADIASHDRVQFGSQLPYRWKWIDNENRAHAFGQLQGPEQVTSYQWLDPAKGDWLEPKDPTGFRLPSANQLEVVVAGGRRVPLDLPNSAEENRRTEYGVVTAASWIRSSPTAPPEFLAVAMSSFPDLLIFRIPKTNEPSTRLVRVLRGHEDQVHSISCSHDGRYLITSSRDRTIRIWTLEGLKGDGGQNSGTLDTWGATFRLTDDGVEVSNLLEAGPLYTPGLRQGDKIVRLAWTEPGADGKLVPQRTQVPLEIFNRLANERFIHAYAFWYRSAGNNNAPERGFRRQSKWEPLLSQVVSPDREWAVWTPSGYYDASMNGDRLFGWQINQGVDRDPDLYSADRFRGLLEKPEVIKNLLNAGNLASAFKLTALSPHGRDHALARSIALQPKVEILSPAAGQVLSEASVPLMARVTVQSGQDVLMPRAFANGVAASRGRLVRTHVEGEQIIHDYQWQSALPSDENIQFQVIAATGEKNVGQAELKSKYRPAQSSSGQIFVIAAGVSTYLDNANIPSLDFAANNARRIGDVLANQSPVRSHNNLTVMTDQSVTPSHWRSTLRTTRDKLRDRVRPDDVLIVFLSGHGVLDPQTNEYRYLTYSARGRDLRARNYRDCLDFSSITSLQDLPCRKVVVLDTCHSGAIQTMETSQIKSIVRLLQGDMAIVLTASEGSQLAEEDRGQNAGKFTALLEEALQGKADRDKNQFVSLHEAIEYVQERMKANSKSQFPTVGPKDLFEYVDFPLTRTSTGTHNASNRRSSDPSLSLVEAQLYPIR